MKEIEIEIARSEINGTIHTHTQTYVRIFVVTLFLSVISHPNITTMFRLCNTTGSSRFIVSAFPPFQNGGGGLYDRRERALKDCLKSKCKNVPSLSLCICCSNRPDSGTQSRKVLGHLTKLSSVLLLSIPAAGRLEGAESVLQAVGVLAAIVTVHECGHFLAAYLQNIRVNKFSIGFGPTLLKLNLRNVECSLRAIPLGGYVGFPDGEQDSGIAADDKDLLRNRPVIDRVIVTIAGVVANIVFAYTILFVQVLTVGAVEKEPFPGVMIPQVFSHSAAARDGMESGDVVLGVNGRLFGVSEPEAVFDLVDVIKKNPGKKLSFLVERRQSDVKQILVTPDVSMEDGTGKIGVQLAPNAKIIKVRANDLAEATVRASKEFRRLLSTVMDELKQVFLNFSKTATKLSGPVAIVAIGAEVARSSSEGMFQFAAIVNLNLAVVNLLPLPALDGGYLALIALEAARGGKKLPHEVEQGIMSSGIALVFFLGVFLIVRDTLNLDFVQEML